MHDVILLILPILLPILAGWIIVQVRILSRPDSHILSLFFLYLAVPSLLIHQLAKQDLADLYDVRYIVAFLLLTIVLYGGVFIVEKLLLKRDVKVSALAAFTGSKFNAVILALPVLMGTLGEAASGPFIINVILGYFTTLPLTIALARVSGKNNGRSAIGHILDVFRNIFTDPLVLSALLGVILATMGARLPDWLDGTLQSLGAAAVPTALVATGMSISLGEVKRAFGEVLWISIVRVVISPALTIVAAMILRLSPVFAIALVLSFGIATAQMVVPLCEKAEAYHAEAADVVAATTVSMVVTLPILIWVCSRFWPGPIKGNL
jgi:malonate transporter